MLLKQNEGRQIRSHKAPVKPPLFGGLPDRPPWQRTEVYTDARKERCTVAHVGLSMGPLYTSEKPKRESQSSHRSLGVQQPLITRGAPWRPHPRGWAAGHIPQHYTPILSRTSWDLPSATPTVLRQACNCRAPLLSLQGSDRYQRH